MSHAYINHLWWWIFICWYCSWLMRYFLLNKLEENGVWLCFSHISFSWISFAHHGQALRPTFGCYQLVNIRFAMTLHLRSKVAAMSLSSLITSFDGQLWRAAINTNPRGIDEIEHMHRKYVPMSDKNANNQNKELCPTDLLFRRNCCSGQRDFVIPLRTYPIELSIYFWQKNFLFFGVQLCVYFSVHIDISCCPAESASDLNWLWQGKSDSLHSIGRCQKIIGRNNHC